MNYKDIIGHFINLKKICPRNTHIHGKNNEGNKNIFAQAEQIEIEDIQLQSQEYFGLQGIGDVDQYLPEPLHVLALQNLSSDDEQEIVKFHDRVCSEIIDKGIEGSITKNSLKKLRLH